MTTLATSWWVSSSFPSFRVVAIVWDSSLPFCHINTSSIFHLSISLLHDFLFSVFFSISFLESVHLNYFLTHAPLASPSHAHTTLASSMLNNSRVWNIKLYSNYKHEMIFTELTWVRETFESARICCSKTELLKNCLTLFHSP